MSNVLIFGDDKAPALRNEVPLPLPDPVAYMEKEDARYVLCGSLDVPRLSALGRYQVIAFEDLGLAGALAEGKALDEAFRVLVARACGQLGVTEAMVPSDFPLQLADELRAVGIALTPDSGEFARRRRSKSPAQLDGIRRAQRAAELALERIRQGLRKQGPTAEALRAEARKVFVEHGALPHDMLVIAAGDHGADPHDEGAGAIPPGVPIVVDVFPRDLASGCWGDITRTFCIGEPPEELVEWHEAVRAAQQKATAAVRAGIGAGELNSIACDVLEARGYPTRRTHAAAGVLEEGFVHYLGHGVGLELHEAPTLDEGGETLVPGDVITIEPGLYRRGFGGCRIEDVAIVTEDGYELVTRFDYELVV